MVLGSMFAGLYPAPPVQWYYPTPRKPSRENPLGITFPEGEGSPSERFPSGSRSDLDEKAGGAWPMPRSLGEAMRSGQSESCLVVNVDSALDIVPSDNFGLHCFCATAYYPGESEADIEARKTSAVQGNQSLNSPNAEDCILHKTVLVPYNSRQQLLMVEIYEVDTDVDTLIARATLPLAEPRLEHTAPWPLVRGSDAGGTLTLNVKFPEDQGFATPKASPKAPKELNQELLDEVSPERNSACRGLALPGDDAMGGSEVKGFPAPISPEGDYVKSKGIAKSLDKDFKDLKPGLFDTLSGGFLDLWVPLTGPPPSLWLKGDVGGFPPLPPRGRPASDRYGHFEGPGFGHDRGQKTPAPRQATGRAPAPPVPAPPVSRAPGIMSTMSMSTMSTTSTMSTVTWPTPASMARPATFVAAAYAPQGMRLQRPVPSQELRGSGRRPSALKDLGSSRRDDFRDDGFRGSVTAVRTGPVPQVAAGSRSWVPPPNYGGGMPMLSFQPASTGLRSAYYAVC
ncbi:unnamed protein product [Effrenium voratum]|uniref:Uncharacterized protein n=1 Tax=Effrenium voratum TaxID=2562239 RepID=A0AA36NJ84_9DINO|nr:unnamed protein product [Effrenium voratum]CAJ1447966.1 unnamed protein product [Effrenium voratum]